MGRHRIIVGVDGSPSSREALVWARETAELRGATLSVIGVSVPHGMTAQGLTPQGLTVQSTAQVHAELEPALRQVVGEDLPISVRRGRAAEELVAAAEDADLLVVGGRGLGGVRALVLGSVSRACLHHARSSVAVVHSPAPVRAPDRGPRVVVGVDGSPCARRALRVAAEEATLRGATLSAVHAVHWEHWGHAFLAPTTEQLADWGLHLLTEELREAGVTARPVVRLGRPAPVLVRASGRADLLVLGSAGHNPLAALTTGSTSDACAHRARCPLLVVR